jgi:hypothetical protein
MPKGTWDGSAIPQLELDELTDATETVHISWFSGHSHALLDHEIGAVGCARWATHAWTSRTTRRQLLFGHSHQLPVIFSVSENERSFLDGDVL